MGSFAEIYADLYKPLQDEKIESLMKILCSKTLETNICASLYDEWHQNCNEVYQDLFISDEEAAKNMQFLKVLGITHVLNTAEGDKFGMVNTGADYYKDSEIKYLGLPLRDVDSEQLIEVVHEAADFIDEGLSSGGKVLVHCVMGVSRSSSTVIAYLMIKKNMTLHEAITQVKKYREIKPNNGFLMQLLDLEKQLRLQS